MASIDKMKIENILIYLQTNIPSVANKNGTNSEVILTKDMIYIPKVEGDISNDDEEDNYDNEKEKYPFFTSTYKYPKDILSRKSYKDKINFFFVKKEFLKILKANVIEPDGVMDTMQYNITTMIEILFTTVYPVINDNTESYSKYTGTHYDMSFKGTIPKILSKLVPSLNVDFTYLKLNEKIYTVKSTCILNDFVNHPEYKKLIISFLKFEEWKRHTADKIIQYDFKSKDDILFNIIKIKYYDVENIFKELNKNTSSSFSELFPKLIKLDLEKDELLERIQKYIKEKNAEARRKSFTKIDLSKIKDDLNDYESIIDDYIGKKNLAHEFDILFKSFNDEYKTLNDLRNLKEKLKNQFNEEDNMKIIENIIYELNIDIMGKIKKTGKFEDILSAIQEKVILSNVYDKYFDETKDITSQDSFKVDEETMKKYVNKHFEKYDEFIKQIKKFTKPNRETGNSVIQEMINDYANIKNTTFGKFIEYVHKKYIDDIKDISFPHEVSEGGPSSSLLFIGVNTYGFDSTIKEQKPKYAAYVHFNLIDGELNSTNINDISCEYKNNQLGKLYRDRKKKNSVLIIKDEFIDLQSMISNEKEKNLKKNQEKILEKKKGGKKRRKSKKKTKRTKRFTTKLRH